jgi:hypothetical protein
MPLWRHIVYDGGGGGVSLTFNLWFLKIYGISNSSAFNIGTNLLIGWNSTNKEVNGVGGYAGDFGRMGSLVAAVDDRDWVDMPVANHQTPALATVVPQPVWRQGY